MKPAPFAVVVLVLLTVLAVALLGIAAAAQGDVVLEEVPPAGAQWQIQVWLPEGSVPPSRVFYSVRRPRPLSGGWMRYYPSAEPGAKAEDVYFGGAVARLSVIEAEPSR